MFIKGSRHTS